jgi:hypothetical protein
MTTRLIATTVSHGTVPGDVHGGCYVIDLQKQTVHQTVEWDSEDIEWFGDEGGRGLRGIAFDGDLIYVAASNRLLAYDQKFRLVNSWENQYLVNCHGISIHERNLFMASTGNNCILAFDLDEKKFHWGMQLASEHFQFKGMTFNPLDSDGPLFVNTLHLNCVQGGEGGMHISGLNTGGLLHFNGENIYMSVQLPAGAQDAKVFRKGVVFNDSRAGVVRYSGDNEGEEDRAMPLPFYVESDHSRQDPDSTRALKRGYARGLCILSDAIVASGCTPAGLSLFDLQKNKRLMTVTFTKDVRMAVNSIEIWPQ